MSPGRGRQTVDVEIFAEAVTEVQARTFPNDEW
jgi:hypothetical protein